MYRNKYWWKNASKYEQYKAWCEVYNLKPDSKATFEKSLELNKKRGKDVSAAEYARYQLHDNMTDKEVMARYNVLNRQRILTGKEPLSFSEFNQKRMWEGLNDEIKKLYNTEKYRLKKLYMEEYGLGEETALEMAIEQAGKIVSLQIFGSE